MNGKKNNRVLFVDRDGVLNKDYVGDYVKRWEDFKFLPGVLESLARLKQAGFCTVVVSNQAGVGDGVYTTEKLAAITARMLEEVKKAGGEIAGVFYCLHGKEAGCDCRKPKTGLFKHASAQFSYERSQTFFVGDKLSDIRAGKDFGLRTILVLTGYGRDHAREVNDQNAPDFICEDFKEAVEIILREPA